jgi:ribosome-associated protein
VNTVPATARWTLDEREVSFTAVRAQGPGGQNVNKVSNAVHLRFCIRSSSLPEAIKARLLALRDRRLTTEGVLVIKAQGARSLELNRAEALARLRELIESVATPPTPRVPTKPTRASVARRIEGKVQRAGITRRRARPQGGELG